MSNQQLIRSAHIWILTVIIAIGLWAIAGKAGIRSQSQNQNQNQNSNSNSNTGSQTQNENANRSQNRNDNSRATGEKAGMGTMSSQDSKFVMEAHMANMMEVELGRMATQQGASDQVKQFGQKMVDDHTAADAELMTLASGKGATLSTTMDDKHRGDITKLSGMSGAEFDRAFSKRMLKDHDKAVDMFEKYSEKGADADLKAFAAKTLPVLQQHLEMARALPGNQRGNNNSNSNSNRGSGNSNRGSGNANGNSNGNSNRP